MQFKLDLYNLFFLFSFVFCEEKLDSEKNKENEISARIDFNVADLSIDYVDKNFQQIHLEAFKSFKNDLIINEKDNSKYGQLVWYSIGHPKIEINQKLLNNLKINNTNINTNFSIFSFNQKGFSMRVQMLSQEHKLEFAKLIKQKYQIDVNLNQIINLVPSKFECKTSFYSTERNRKIFLYGLVKNFHEYPLRVDFNYEKITTKNCQFFESCLFEKHIKSEENLLNLEFDCNLNSNNYFGKQFTLYIDQTSFDLEGNLFLEDYLNKKFQQIDEKLDQNVARIDQHIGDNLKQNENFQQLVKEDVQNIVNLTLGISENAIKTEIEVNRVKEFVNFSSNYKVREIF